jgi:diadenosine tetraphosphate (Ap4A) HIT family hydrolase
MATDECDFCHEFSGNLENSFHRLYGGDPETRILFQSTEFAVLPSLGQVVEGYLLLLPRQHFGAIGDLSPRHMDELATVLYRAGEILKREYGPYIVFEHGTRSEGVGGCGIYHAHLHAAPLGGVSDPIELLKQRFPFTELAHLKEISKRSAGLPSYLFYQDSDARLYLFDTGPLPSQYMRKVLADAVGEHNWNWRDAGREERLLATTQRLSRQFDNIQNLAHSSNP